jgi:hypothetical protein
MLIPNHPEDERLSALAARETDAAADTTLVSHVMSCTRCTALVDELGALRASLAELPDMKPSRPLRLLPEVAEAPSSADRLGGWARRFFGPVLAAGAAVAMVGLVGTAAPALDSMASGDAAAPQSTSMMELEGADGGGEAPAAAASDAGTAEGAESDEERTGAAASDQAQGEAFSAENEAQRDLAAQQPPTDERPLWPMLLFVGLAVMVGAGLMRWIFVPSSESQR